jgi:hypothetical protein
MPVLASTGVDRRLLKQFHAGWGIGVHFSYEIERRFMISAGRKFAPRTGEATKSPRDASQIAAMAAMGTRNCHAELGSGGATSARERPLLLRLPRWVRHWAVMTSNQAALPGISVLRSTPVLPFVITRRPEGICAPNTARFSRGTINVI